MWNVRSIGRYDGYNAFWINRRRKMAGGWGSLLDLFLSESHASSRWPSVNYVMEANRRRDESKDYVSFFFCVSLHTRKKMMRYWTVELKKIDYYSGKKFCSFFDLYFLWNIFINMNKEYILNIEYRLWVRYTWQKRYVLTLKCKLGKIYNIVNILEIKGDTHALSREWINGNIK